MEDQEETTPGAAGPKAGNADIYGEDGVIRPSFLSRISARRSPTAIR